MEFQIGPGPRLSLDEKSALDILDCVVDGVNLAPGKAVPDDGDARILHSVGGFLFTCGPEHIRHPEPIKGGHGEKYPLHGSMAGNPAKIISSSQTRECLEVVAQITIPLAGGGQATVNRLWRMNSATGETMIEDRLLNSGDRPFEPMWMYHMNIGAHLFDDDTRLSGTMIENGSTGWRFGEGDGHIFCVPATQGPRDHFAHVSLGPIAAIGGKVLQVMFSTGTLGHLQVWRNQQAPAHVLGIEPVSHPWKNRGELEADGLMEILEPGGLKIYRLGFSFA